MSKKKEYGQYMTPPEIVVMILDNVGYTGSDILNKKIMEPSFGDGVFLSEIVKRIIKECKKKNISNDKIAVILDNNIYGIEKDKLYFDKAIQRLNDILKHENIPKVKWSHLQNGDTLKLYTSLIGSMDYCVGNPPFVRIHNIPESERDILKEFQFSGGMSDLYIVFYEIGLKILKDGGKLGFISPNSFMRNMSQRTFRKFICDSHYLQAIYDFKDSKIFPDADTYTCICLLCKSPQSNNDDKCKCNIRYRIYNKYNLLSESSITALPSNGGAWNFSSKDDMEFMEENESCNMKLKDIADIQNGISTNCDYAYIFEIYTDKEMMMPYMGKHTDLSKTVYFRHPGTGQATEIESSILRRCVKESKFIGKIDNTYIIYPYENSCQISEDSLKKKCPKAYAYLLTMKNKLSERNMDKSTDWFLFARSQGIKNMDQKKIVFKHIIDKSSNNIISYIVDDDIVVYSGVYITMPASAKNDVINASCASDSCQHLEKIKSIISDSDFKRYCVLSGKDMSGGYVSVSSKIIKNYGIQKDSAE